VGELKFDMLDMKNLVTTFNPGEPTGDDLAHNRLPFPGNL